MDLSILPDNDCEHCECYYICPVDNGEKCVKEDEGE